MHLGWVSGQLGREEVGVSVALDTAERGTGLDKVRIVDGRRLCCIGCSWMEERERAQATCGAHLAVQRRTGRGS